jgi:hypothetical protein
MSLLGFQRALAALISDPALVRRVIREPAVALATYDLTCQDLARLATMARSRGMSTNCILYRANRLTPLARLLPLTLAAIGSDLRDVLDRYWRIRPETSFQFAGEVASFGHFLKCEIASGSLLDGKLEGVLDLELARCGALLPAWTNPAMANRRAIDGD